MEIAQDRVVTLEYKMFVEGEMVDSSQENGPLTYLHGYEQIVPGLEKRLEGMTVGDSRTVEVPTAEGFGEYDEENVQQIDRDEFPSDIEPVPGLVLYTSLGEGDDEEGEEGQESEEDEEDDQVIIREVTDEYVVVDFNHPLAGKDLRFEVTVLEVREATEEELDHGHAHPDGMEPEDDEA